jgi:hypothetical protein
LDKLRSSGKIALASFATHTRIQYILAYRGNSSTQDQQDKRGRFPTSNSPEASRPRHKTTQDSAFHMTGVSTVPNAYVWMHVCTPYVCMYMCMCVYSVSMCIYVCMYEWWATAEPWLGRRIPLSGNARNAYAECRSRSKNVVCEKAAMYVRSRELDDYVA